MIITQATLQDMDGVFAILRANHVSNVPEEEKKNGFVTTNLTEEQMKALIEKENGEYPEITHLSEVIDMFNQ